MLTFYCSVWEDAEVFSASVKFLFCSDMRTGVLQSPKRSLLIIKFTAPPGIKPPASKSTVHEPINYTSSAFPGI